VEFAAMDSHRLRLDGRFAWAAAEIKIMNKGERMPPLFYAASGRNNSSSK
jgi:hypothetical protein